MVPQHKSLNDHKISLIDENMIKFLNDHNSNVLQWPGNSPDLNPIENTRNVLNKKFKKRDQAISRAEKTVGNPGLHLLSLPS